MPEFKEEETVPLVVNNPRDYLSVLARTRLDLNSEKLQRALEADIVGSPAQLASTFDKVEGREVVLDYLSPSGKRIKISSDGQYPEGSKRGKVSSLLEAAARFKVLESEQVVPEQVKFAGWQLNRGIKDFQNEAERIVSGKTLEGTKAAIAKKAAVLSLALTACSANLGGVLSRPVGIETSTPTAAEVFTPTTEASPTPEATSTPTMEPTPTPTPTPALFEYNFQVGEAGQVPEELRDLMSGEVVFNRSEDAGGNISLEEVRREGYTPLVGEGDVLSVEVGEVAFLSFPSELSGYAYSAENSGSGFAAYVDQQGEVRIKMLTTLSVTEDANYVVAFSSDSWGGRGDIYGLILNSAGDIVSRIDITFAESEELESAIVNGCVRIYIDGERMILEDGKFVRPEAGYSRGLELSALPQELTIEISPEQIGNLRFMDSQGNPVLYGYLGEEEYLTGEGEVGLEILRFHAIFRGQIPDAAFPGLPQEAIEYSDYYLIEIPQERFDSATGQYVRAGESQFIIMVSMNDRLAAEIEVYWMSNNQIDFSSLPIPRYTQRPQVGEVFRRMPPGTSIIVGIQNVPNAPEYEWLKDFLLSQEQGIPAETDGWFIPETLFLPGNLR